MHPPLPGDKKAGFIGLIAGFVSILITVVVIVQLTNRKFESHAPAPHTPPPPGATTPAAAPAPH